MKKNWSLVAFFRSSLSSILIFLLLVSQTIHVSFFDSAEAQIEESRDIVSFFVDKETQAYASSEIRRYANDIQGYLKNTRVRIIIVDPKTPPEAIAAKNEKLYYDGDGEDKLSRLVGTVLIGNIPIPLVRKEGARFPSLYPYVDFDDKTFVYDKQSSVYEYSHDAPSTASVEIWHGVINPAVGRSWDGVNDREKIKKFLNKTHEFYMRSGKFAPSDIPPRVFYYDGYNESRALNPKDFYKYTLYLKNAENIAYYRFTKYLLQDVSRAIKQNNEAGRGEEDEYLNSIPGFENVTLGDDALSGDDTKNLPDIQTPRIVMKYLTKFHETLGQKTLGDIPKFVHNAGRYNSGTTVRVDHGAIDMTLTDEIALRTLKEANDALEKAIKQKIKNGNYIRKAIVFDGLEEHIVRPAGPISGNPLPTPGQKIVDGTPFSSMSLPSAPENRIATKTYLGYFFGTQSRKVTLPSECTIARGKNESVTEPGSFGRALLAEANIAFDIGSTQPQVATLSGDTDELLRAYGSANKSCFSGNGQIKTRSYWGENSILALTNAGSPIETLFSNPPSGGSFSGFSSPILSLSGMKETTRLPPPSLKACDPGEGQGYALLQPYVYPEESGDDRGNPVLVKWPEELGRFTCITQHRLFPEQLKTFPKSIQDYETRSCFYGSLVLDGKYLNGNTLTPSPTKLGRTCIVVGSEGSEGQDNTKYEDRYYHTIDSFFEHTSPTDEEISAAKSAQMTPSLAVDRIRTFEFITAKGNRVSFTYPNLFQAPGSDKESVRTWLKNLSQTEWNVAIQKENTTPIDTYEQRTSALFQTASLPSSPLDWNSLISDDTIEKAIRAKNWLNPDVTTKYKSLVETHLSYSHEYGTNDPKNPPLIPRQGNGYEIAYLGLKPFTLKNTDTEDTHGFSEYTQKLKEIEGANYSEEEPGDHNPDNRASAQCGPPEGVSLFQWPSAIMCWLKSLLPPKISVGSCTSETIGLPKHQDFEKNPVLPPMAGDCSSIEIKPASPILIAGSQSVGILRLLDSGGNPMSPNIHNLTLGIENGYLIDKEGTRTTFLSFPVTEPEISFSYGSDQPGNIIIHTTLDNGVTKDQSLTSIGSAKVRIIPSAPIKVGGPKVDLTLEVQDEAGHLLQGFNSAVAFDLPQDTGYLSGEIFPITNGKSGPITFTPGRKSGNQKIALEIPGIGYVTDIDFPILHGDPMYISGRASGDTLEFTLRDRYGNMTPVDMSATVKKEGGAPQASAFSAGKLSISGATPGYWRIEAPDIARNQITYTDDGHIQASDGSVSVEQVNHTLVGIPFYTQYVSPPLGKYDFLPDYNARYTVLAGDSYLREGEDILYGTTPGASQSIAVSTVLSTPYARKSLFSLLPGGGYTTEQDIDTAIVSSITLEGSTLVLGVFDTVSRYSIAKAGYPLKNLTPTVCDRIDSCTPSPKGRIALVLSPSSGYRTRATDASFSLEKNTTSRISYSKDTGLSLSPGVRLIPLPEKSQGALTMSVEDGGSQIAEIILSTPLDKSVTLGSLSSSLTDLTLEAGTDLNPEPLGGTTLGSSVIGYELTRNSPSGETSSLDENTLTQNGVDSFAALSEIPGVGWHDNNRTLLSYAAGDTVGEATRWYHSYTLVNLGDPVTHVDLSAKGTEFEGVDRTIGTQIASSAHGAIRSYDRRDMDGDTDQDIVIFYSDGFVELLLNQSGKFHRKQMIAYLPDGGGRGVSLGDFTGDRYADILSVDKEGKFVLLNNTERRFSSGKLILIDGALSSLSSVNQFKIYDMDADGKDDVVYLTEGGELGILYGTETGGNFSRKILESNMGIRLSDDPVEGGGAIKSSRTPNTLLSLSLANKNDPDNGVLNSEVFYQRAIVQSPPPGTNTDVSLDQQADVDRAIENATTPSGTVVPDHAIYVRSEYARAYGLEITKRYKNTTSQTLKGGHKIEVEITLKNTSSSAVEDIEYLDTIPDAMDAEDTRRYKVQIGATASDKDFQFLHGDEYDALFAVPSLPIGGTAKITYSLTSFPVSYGEMIVDNLERGTAGDDRYGDVGFQTSKNCGDDMMVWMSDNTSLRTYIRSSRTFSPSELPPALASRLADADKNGVPDSIENMSREKLSEEYKKMGDGTSLLPQRPFFQANYSSDDRLLTLDFDQDAEAGLETLAQDIANGLACGFGGGSCMNFPINWAPLAPGGSLSVLGMPVNPAGMTPNVGLPIFSGLTGFLGYCGTSTCCLPTTYPASPLGFVPGPSCLPPSAGGSLGTTAPTNTFRVYVTPTLTLGMGAAVCMGGPAIVKGTNLAYPLMPTGNCIVAAAPMPFCKGDGSDQDGDIRGLSGLGSARTSWNGGSCQVQGTQTTHEQNQTLRDDIVNYLKSPTPNRLSPIYTSLSRRGSRTGVEMGPFVRMGDVSSDGTVVEMSFDALKPFNPGNVIKVHNRRIAGFPEFIMDWVSRQTDEITNKLLTPPSLFIIPPRIFAQNGTLDKGYENFLSRFSADRFQKGYEELSQKMGAAYDATLRQEQSNAQKRSQTSTARTTGYSALDSARSGLAGARRSLDDTLSYAKGGASSLQAAYQFIGQIPFIRIEKEVIPIAIPWILPQELDRYARSLNAYKAEIDSAKQSWCNGTPSASCLDQHVNANFSSLTASIDANLKRIDEYRRFPEKIQKYLTWKQRYIAQLLCNVDAVEQMLGGWYRDNGIRFRKWAELYVLLKAIVSSWQPLIDIFKVREEECSVCRNERWDLKYFKIRLLSALIPQLPIIQFPKWPDIILDLSDIRLGIAVKVPDFRFDINPIRLPNLPALSLPRLPNVTVNLPSIPTLPPIPTLPDLPDLPSLPRISLPSLPPPPKLPKIFGAVSATLKILKLFMKVYCFMQKTPLVPEDYVGSTIAQRTDRQGTMSFDFLSVNLPQIAIPMIKQIRVSTHVNFELRSDFITEFARAVVKPINEFGADLTKNVTFPTPSLQINTPQNIQITLPPVSQRKSIKSFSGLIASLEKSAHTLVDGDELYRYFRSELQDIGGDVALLDRSIEQARHDADGLTQKIQNTQKQGWKLLKTYLHTEEAENALLMKKLENMYRDDLLADISLPRAFFASHDEDLSDSALGRYETWRQKSLETLPPVAALDDTSFQRERASLRGRIDRLIASHTPTHVGVNTAGVDSLPEGYSQKFEGIYILSPTTKKQVRLFDYTDLVGPEDRVDIYDIDKDGDNDYIFLLGEKLYIKYTHTHSPNLPEDTTLIRENLDADLRPIAPNFFHETVSSPGRMEISFSPAEKNQRTFRLEFFDRYMEWDRVKSEGADAGDTPRTVVDMVSSPEVSVRSDGIEVAPVDRSIRSVSDPTHFTLEGQKFQILSPGQLFGLSAGRALYSGDTPLKLRYSTGTTTNDITLERFQRYVFPASISGTLIAGKGYVITPVSTERLSYSSDMIGMPLLPDTRIESDGEVIIDNPQNTRERPYTLVPGASYRQVSLGSLAESYTVSFPYPNGFYSARLAPLGSDTHAGVTLIAPQASLDQSPPVVDIPDALRIPVYTNKQIPLRNIITEMSSYQVLVDGDVTVDSDNNGINNDDFAPSGIGFSLPPDMLDLGPFDTLGKRFMNISVKDIYGNATEAPLQIDVYAPIPQIRNVSPAGMLVGGLDEAIASEPIHLFRVREGEGLDKLSSEKTMTQSDGTYSTGTIFRGSDVVISTPSGAGVIDEHTGIPKASAPFQYRFVPATSTTPMKIIVSEGDNTVVTQNIIAPYGVRLTSSDIGFDALPVPSILLSSEAGYTVSPAHFSDPSIPGGMYIVDSRLQPIVALDARGQVYPLVSDITFSVERDRYLKLLVRSGNKNIATIRYKIDFFYTLQ